MARFWKIKKLPWPVPSLFAGIIRLWAATLRVTTRDPHGVMDYLRTNPCIVVLWHNRLVLLPAFAPRWLRGRLVFLASLSRDGGYISDVLHRFGMVAVRGSSSRGGAAALRELQQHLVAGRCVLITPDGPRGPRYEVQPGAVWLAAASGVPLVPVSLNSPHHWELKSWDRTQFPVPFSRVELTIGEPLRCPSDSPEVHAQVKAALLAVTTGDHPAPPPAPPKPAPAAPPAHKTAGS